jgi:hypothetical protein
MFAFKSGKLGKEVDDRTAELTAEAIRVTGVRRLELDRHHTSLNGVRGLPSHHA